MKKLLVLLLLTLSTFVGEAQTFKSYNFLNVQSMVLSNGFGFTNISQYWGQNSLFTTNNLFSYTNIDGTFVYDFLSNTNTGITVTTNGYILYTNDVTTIAKDALFHSDTLGNPCTNYTISCAFAGSSAFTNFFAVFAPLIKGGTAQGGPNLGVIPPILGTSGSVGTIIDTTNQFTLTFTGKKSGLDTSVQQLPTSLSLTGYKGLRLLYAYTTNALTTVNILDLSLNTYQP